MWIKRNEEQAPLRFGMRRFCAIMAITTSLASATTMNAQTARDLQSTAQSFAEASNAIRVREPYDKRFGKRGKIVIQRVAGKQTAQIGSVDGCTFAGEFMAEEAAQVLQVFVGEQAYAAAHKSDNLSFNAAEAASEARDYLICTSKNRPRLQKFMQRAKCG